jgi:hypothetical protein
MIILTKIVLHHSNDCKTPGLRKFGELNIEVINVDIEFDSTKKLGQYRKKIQSERRIKEIYFTYYEK